MDIIETSKHFMVQGIENVGDSALYGELLTLEMRAVDLTECCCTTTKRTFKTGGTQKLCKMPTSSII